MRVIFLDVDGVLNRRSTPYAARWTADELASRGVEIDLVDRFGSLVADTGARVVLSSTWRTTERTMSAATMALARVGVAIAGATEPDPVAWKMSEIIPWQRGAQIGRWLAAHPDVAAFAVLDDCRPESAAPSPVRERWVLVRDGLTPTDVARAHGWLLTPSRALT